jgi:nitrate/nitrite transport system permease protein
MTVLKPFEQLDEGPAATATMPGQQPVPTPPSPAPGDEVAVRPSVLARIGSAAGAVATGLLGLGILVGLWAIAAWRVDGLPSPAATFTELTSLLSSPFHDSGPNDKGIGIQLAGSLQRVFMGFTFAAVLGIPFGLLVGANRWVRRAANPVIQLLRPVSPLAWFPIWLVVFKDAPRAAVWVIFITALWPIVINTAAGAAAIPRDHANVARVFHFGRWAYIRHVLLPDSMSAILTGLRISMGVAWLVIVAVEMLSGGTGIGFFVWDAYNALNLAKVISAIILIGGVGLAIDLVFIRLARAFSIEGTAK